VPGDGEQVLDEKSAGSSQVQARLDTVGFEPRGPAASNTGDLGYGELRQEFGLVVGILNGNGPARLGPVREQLGQGPRPCECNGHR
jgi:hypothetical protein